MVREIGPQHKPRPSETPSFAKQVPSRGGALKQFFQGVFHAPFQWVKALFTSPTAKLGNDLGRLLGGRAPRKELDGYAKELAKHGLLRKTQGYLNALIAVQKNRSEFPGDVKRKQLKLELESLKTELASHPSLRKLPALLNEITANTLLPNTQLVHEAIGSLYTSDAEKGPRELPFLAQEEGPSLVTNFQLLDPIDPEAEEVLVPKYLEYHVTNPQTMETRTARIELPFEEKTMKGADLVEKLQGLHNAVANLQTDTRSAEWFKTHPEAPLLRARGDFNATENAQKGAWAQESAAKQKSKEQVAGLKHIFLQEGGTLALHPTSKEASFTVDKATLKKIQGDRGEVPIYVDGEATLAFQKESAQLKGGDNYLKLTLTITRGEKHATHRAVFLSEEELAAPGRLEREVLLAKGEYFRRYYG